MGFVMFVGLKKLSIAPNNAANGFLLVLGIWGAVAVEAIAGLKIYYIRHAEAGHNVKEEWESVRKKDWPSFVGDQQKFTPKGEIQRTEAIRKLDRYDFDFIAVSPMWRTRHTILPYLKETKTKAEIWPELHEMYVSSIIVSSDLPKHRGEILGKGDRIEIPDAETRYFSLRKDGTREFELPRFKDGHVEKEAETAAAKVILQRVADMIKEQFSSDDSVLLVGHGSSGKGLLRFLTGDPLSGFPSLTNAGVWMVEEQPDGQFELMLYNDVPLKPEKQQRPYSAKTTSDAACPPPKNSSNHAPTRGGTNICPDWRMHRFASQKGCRLLTAGLTIGNPPDD